MNDPAYFRDLINRILLEDINEANPVAKPSWSRYYKRKERLIDMRPNADVGGAVISQMIVDPFGKSGAEVSLRYAPTTEDDDKKIKDLCSKWVANMFGVTGKDFKPVEHIPHEHLWISSVELGQKLQSIISQFAR